MTNNKNVFRQKFTRIEGLSAIRRLPRLGKIRLGIKKMSAKTGKEYPSETKYFVCPPEIRKIYGDEPTELNIMFPLNDPETLFPQSYQWFGSSKGLKCKGDGVNATRLNEDTNVMEERTCPCDLLEEGKCKQRASLVFMMPTIKIGGVYQIDLGSYHSIVDINSSLDYAMAMLDGRIAMVPFKLRRVPKETHSNGKKQTHYTLQLELDIPLEHAQRIREGENIFRGQNKVYEIEERKEDINPAYDSKEDGAVIVEETEEDIRAREEKEAEQKKAEKEALKKENEGYDKRETDLKEAKKIGGITLRTPAQVKEIMEKKKAKIAEVLRIARAYKVNSWDEVMDIGVRHKIFFEGIVASQAKTYICDNPEAYDALLEVIKKDQEIADEDIPD